MQVNSYRHFESQKKQHKQNKINTHGFWWYIEVLLSEIIDLHRKLKIMYNIITCNSEPEANGEVSFFELVLSVSLFQGTGSNIWFTTKTCTQLYY